MRITCLSLLALLVLPACDSGGKKKEANPDAAKAAAEAKAEEDRIAERKKQREAKAAAAKKAEEDKKKVIEELCVVPPDANKPKKLDQACDALANAQSDFLARQYADDKDALAKLEKNAPMQKQNMLRMCTSMDVAVGLKNAFDNAPMGMAKDMNDIIATCMQKLGPAQGGGAAVPQKKPG